MKKQIFKAKVKPNQLVEFKVDDEQPNKIGIVLAVTFDGRDQIFYCIQDMYSLEGYIFESVDEEDIVRILSDEEYWLSIKQLTNKDAENKIKADIDKLRSIRYDLNFKE